MDKVLKASRLPKNSREDDFVDRLSNRYTVNMLVIFAVVLSVTSWVRKPIHCWFPKYITKYQRRYGHSYCWGGQHVLPAVHRVHPTDRSARQATGHPVLPVGTVDSGSRRALFFWLPSLVWRQLSSKAGHQRRRPAGLGHRIQNTRQTDHRQSRAQSPR